MHSSTEQMVWERPVGLGKERTMPDTTSGMTHIRETEEFTAFLQKGNNKIKG